MGDKKTHAFYLNKKQQKKVTTLIPTKRLGNPKAYQCDEGLKNAQLLHRHNLK